MDLTELTELIKLANKKLKGMRIICNSATYGIEGFTRRPNTKGSGYGDYYLPGTILKFEISQNGVIVYIDYEEEEDYRRIFIVQIENLINTGKARSPFSDRSGTDFWVTDFKRKKPEKTDNYYFCGFCGHSSDAPITIKTQDNSNKIGEKEVCENCHLPGLTIYKRRKR